MSLFWIIIDKKASKFVSLFFYLTVHTCEKRSAIWSYYHSDVFLICKWLDRQFDFICISIFIHLTMCMFLMSATDNKNSTDTAQWPLHGTGSCLPSSTSAGISLGSAHGYTFWELPPNVQFFAMLLGSCRLDEYGLRSIGLASCRLVWKMIKKIVQKCKPVTLVSTSLGFWEVYRRMSLIIPGFSLK
jgi:hypothetical protein